MRFWHAFKGAAAAVVFVVAQHAWAGPVVYQQAWDGTSLVYGSQNDPTPGGGGAFGTVYDDFTLDRAQPLTGVQWTGGFYNPGTPAPIEAFTIQFYADAGGAPGASLYSTRQAATATFLGYQDNFAFGPLAFYSYSMDLAFDFLVDAATRYWVSIVPDLALIGFTQQWGIARSNQGNGIAIQDFTGVRSVRADVAFSLFASDVAAVPTPGSLPLVAVALAGLLVLSRRRPAATGASRRDTMHGLPAMDFDGMPSAVGLPGLHVEPQGRRERNGGGRPEHGPDDRRCGVRQLAVGIPGLEQEQHADQPDAERQLRLLSVLGVHRAPQGSF